MFKIWFESLVRYPSAFFENLQSEKIIVLPHINADADAYGSCFSIAYAMQALHKKVLVLAEEALEENLQFMNPGVEFAVYKEAGELLKSEFKNYDIIQLDSNSPDRLGERAALLNKAEFHLILDHHHVNVTENGNLVEKAITVTDKYAFHIDPDFSSCSEMSAAYIALLAEHKNLKFVDLTSQSSINAMMAGLYADTGSLSYTGVNDMSFLTAAVLQGAGADPTFISKKLFEEIAYESLLLRSETLSGARYEKGSIFSIAVVDPEAAEKYGAEGSDYSSIVASLRKIKGVQGAFLLRHEPDKSRAPFEVGKDMLLYKVSIRANEKFDALSLARKLHGGGHAKAAGGFVAAENDEKAIEEVLAKADESMREAADSEL